VLAAAHLQRGRAQAGKGHLQVGARMRAGHQGRNDSSRQQGDLLEVKLAAMMADTFEKGYPWPAAHLPSVSIPCRYPAPPSYLPPPPPTHTHMLQPTHPPAAPGHHCHILPQRRHRQLPRRRPRALCSLTRHQPHHCPLHQRRPAPPPSHPRQVQLLLGVDLPSR
jgi:hypothetical protein